MGTLPRKSGNAKVVVPLPPNIVPRMEKSAVFCVIARSWPLHSAYRTGAKFRPHMRISPIYGVDIETSPSSILRRENAKESNQERDRKRRHHVLVRQAASGGRERLWVHRNRRRVWREVLDLRVFGDDVVRRNVRRAGRCRR